MRMGVVSLITICLLGTVFFTDFANAITGNNHLGRINVSKYAEEHSDDPLVIQKNAICAKVTYPSLTLYRSSIDVDFLIGSEIGVEEYRLLPQIGTFVTVNHHGHPNYIEFSGPLSAFASIKGDGDTYKYVCVHKEPIKGLPEAGIEPHVSVDWISFMSELGSASVSITQEEAVPLGSVYILQFSRFLADPLFTTMMFDIKFHNGSEFSNDGAVWINSYTVYSNAVYTHELVLCVYLSNLTSEALSYNVEAIFFGIVEGATVNLGSPPSPDSYLTENGNIKLKVAENSTADWTLLCTDYPFIQKYTSTPHVFISISFRGKTETDVIEPAITSWVEFINEVGFRACMGRPRYAGEIPLDAAIPYLEYLVISQDGVYNAYLETKLKLGLIITMELVFPTNFIVENFLKVYATRMELNNLLKTMIVGTFLYDYDNLGYMAHPKRSNQVYLFVSFLADDASVAENFVSQLEAHFADGYFPYLANLESYVGGNLMNAIYPTGEPENDVKRVKAKFWTYRGCPVGPFNISGMCSVEECDNNITSGTKTISRVTLSENPSDFCPPLSIVVSCNLPPCTLEAQIFFEKPTVRSVDLQKNPHDTRESPVNYTAALNGNLDSRSGGTNLMLWVLIGVIVVLAIIGCRAYLCSENTKITDSVNQPLIESI